MVLLWSSGHIVHVCLFTAIILSAVSPEYRKTSRLHGAKASDNLNVYKVSQAQWVHGNMRNFNSTKFQTFRSLEFLSSYVVVLEHY